MSSGTIEQNWATFGGGVYTNDSVIVRGDAEITNNRSETLAGGLYIQEYGELTISGSVKITDNKNGAFDNNVVDNNVYIAKEAAAPIEIDDGLSDTSSIGVTMENPGVFTYGGLFESKEAAQAVFSSDDSDYEVITDEEGNAKLKNAPLKYIQRSWNGSTVTETEKSVEDYNVIHDTHSQEHDLTGWYVVKGNVTFGPRIEMSGEVNLILCDGATLTAPMGIEVAEDNILNIYGQSGDTGTLIATGQDYPYWSNPSAGIGNGFYSHDNAGTVNIHGGNIIATGATIYESGEKKAGGAGIGGCGNSGSNDYRDGYNGGTVNIYGGIVTATGGAYAAGIGGGGTIEFAEATNGAGVNIYGGTVTTKGGVNAVGIGGGSYRDGEYFSDHGSLELGVGMHLYGNATTEHPENDANNHREKSGGDYVRTRYMTVNNVAPPHSHSFKYSFDGATITATCTNTDGRHSGDASSTLTIVAPTLTTYGGTGSAAATIAGSIDGVTNPDIVYKNGDTVLDAAPTDAGTYTASITFTDVSLTVGGTGDVTATVEYTIEPAALTDVSVEQNGTLTYTGAAQTPVVTASATSVNDQTVTFTYSLTQDGTYGSMPTVTNVNDCGTIYYKASAPNHSDVTGSFIVSMNKADQAKPEAPTKISATISSITLDIIAGFEYKISTGDWQDSNVFSGLDMNTEYSFYQRIKGDDNYNASPESDAAVLRTNDHSHEWTYTSNSATITATCANADGGHSGDTVSTLTIVAPTLTTYGGTGNAAATIEGSIDGVTNPDIVYKNGDTVLAAAPTDAGTYTANITFENVDLTDGGTGNVTASVEYTIAPATLTGVSVEQSGTLTYTGEAQTPSVTASATAVGGQDVTFTYSLTQDGTYGDMPTVTNVSDCGTIYYKASAPNHSDVTGSFTVSMNKADKEAPVAPTATSTSVNSITLDSIPNGRYKLGDGEWQTSPTFTGLEMNTSYTFYQKYAEDSNYNESLSSAGADISTSNHVHEWSYQADGTTITATCADTDGGHGTPNTATLTLIRPELTKYGGTESAEVTFTGGIDGVVPVVVYKKGNEVLDGAPTDAGSYTASVTIDGVTASIEYEIEKADAPVLSDGQKPTKKENIIYDGTEKELITGPDDNITGYTMKYAVTTTDTVPDDSEFDTSIPNETNAGTYYVWYKAFADNSNNCKDTEPASLLVNIAPRKVTVSGIIALNKTYDGTDSAILDYSNVTFDGIVDDDTLTVSATGKFVDSDVSVDGSGEVVAKIVNITGLILDGADVDNYELAQDGQQTTTTATIKKKTVTVTALDQIVAIKGNIDDSLDMAVLDGAVEGHKLAEIKLTSGSTASATADGVITPGEAKIVSVDVDVTGNYEITYINGVMTVTKADSEVILDKTSVGEDTSVAAVESPNLQEFADKLAEDGKLVKVELNVKPVAEDELEADAVSGIKAAADKLFANVGKETVKIEYLEIDMTKYVDGIKQGAISDTNTPIEIAVTYNTDKAKNPVVIRRHDGAVSVFDLLSSKPAGSYKDASYYLEGDKIHIYSQYFSDFAIVYSVEKTFNVNLDNGMDEVIRVIVPEGTKYTPPTDLTRDGYDFGGWYKDETFTEKWNPDTDTVTADMKLFAKWVKKADSTTPTDTGSNTTPADNGSSTTPATPATTQTVTPAATNTTPAADTTKKSVDTGDHSHVAVAIMLMIDSVLAAVYLTLLKRKRLK